MNGISCDISLPRNPDLDPVDSSLSRVKLLRQFPRQGASLPYLRLVINQELATVEVFICKINTFTCIPARPQQSWQIPFGSQSSSFISDYTLKPGQLLIFYPQICP